MKELNYQERMIINGGYDLAIYGMASLVVIGLMLPYVKKGNIGKILMMGGSILIITGIGAIAESCGISEYVKNWKEKISS